MTTLPKPLPCPWCDWYPTVSPKNPAAEGSCWAEVLCDNDECPVQPWTNAGIDVNDDRGSDEYKRAAIERWNARAKPS